MKKISKVLLSSVLTLLSVLVVLTSLPMAMAAEAGTLVSNPIILSDGVYHTKYWTSNNWRLNCYNKIVVPSRGYITFTAQKPFDDEGEMGSYVLTLYKEDGTVAWEADTSPQKDGFSDSYVYKIGLDAGIYYMNIAPSFYLYSDSAPIATTYKYDFKEDSYWEIEANGTQSTATKIELDKMYSGVYTEETTDTPGMDYYAIKLTKGDNYRIKIENYIELDSVVPFMRVMIIDPSGEEQYFEDYKESGEICYMDFVAKKTGTYYLKLSCISSSERGVEYKIGVFLRTFTASQLKFSLSKSSYAYDGKIKTPAVTVKHGNKKLVENTHYTAQYQTGRKNVGEYKVTIKLKGSYTGTKTLKFKIVPKTIDKAKMTATQTTNTITLKWPKVAGVTGYKVYQYNENKEKYVFAGTVSKNTFKKSGLKAGNTYKYRVTAYKKLSSGTILESAASKVFTTGTKCVAPQITDLYKYSWDTEINVEIKEVNGADGYEYHYSNKKNSGFKKAKLEYSADYDWNCFTPVKAYRNKRLYVKVRAYKNVGGKKIYSAWSKVKSVNA